MLGHCLGTSPSLLNSLEKCFIRKYFRSMHFIFMKLRSYNSANSSAFSQRDLIFISLAYFLPPISSLLYTFWMEFLDLKETFFNSSLRVAQNF